jgi:hypothetical protein
VNHKADLDLAQLFAQNRSNDYRHAVTAKLRKELNKVLVPKERVISRGRGCWNCKSWDRDAAKPLWTEKRQVDLQTALNLALDLPDGEPTSAADCKTPEALHCYNIKSMVNSLDHLVASGHVGVCMGNGRTANGDSVGDFVAHAFLCDRWSGVAGASLAIQGKADLLPEELAENMKKLPS